jgi:ribosomal protein S18 acetylase RimI-like enzyme
MQVTKVDFDDPGQAADFVMLMSHYACDEMGGGVDLSPEVKRDLPAALRGRAHWVSFIAYADCRAAGLINCVEGFSTFACKPLLNIHDVIVHSDFRGRQIAGQLMQEVEREARDRGCCKLTLEVLSGNEPAQKAYTRFGFAPYELDPEHGRAEFWQKVLQK